MRVFPTCRCLTGLALVAILASACASVIPHVSLPPLALGEPSFFPTLEAYSSAPLVGGNRVDLLFNGEESFPAQIRAVRAARRSITAVQHWSLPRDHL